MKANSPLLHKLLVGASLAVLLPLIAWKTGLAVCIAQHAAAFAAEGRVFNSTDEVRNSDIALVLGTSIRGELLKQRVHTAADLFHAGKVKYLLLSGDGRVANYHEPHAMRVMLAALGVPNNCMFEDPAGLSTYDSVQHAISLAGGAMVTVVSQEAHCRRAIMLARGMGSDVQALVAPGLPDARKLSHREELATVRALLDLLGMRRLTTQWKHDREVTVASVRFELPSQAN